MRRDHRLTRTRGLPHVVIELIVGHQSHALGLLSHFGR